MVDDEKTEKDITVGKPHAEFEIINQIIRDGDCQWPSTEEQIKALSTPLRNDVQQQTWVLQKTTAIFLFHLAMVCTYKIHMTKLI